MKIVKPDHLGLLYRCSGTVDQPRLVVGMLGLFRFGAVGPESLLPEPQLWQQVAHALGEDAVLDEGGAKPGAEWMVYGDAFAPGSVPVPSLDVTVRVGTAAKTVRVFGDRIWLGRRRHSAPQPFVRMPVAADYAYGGSGYPQNLSGKGFVAAGGAVPEGLGLPNVEHPDAPLTEVGQVLAPAGFWGLPAHAPQRRDVLGACAGAQPDAGSPGLPARDGYWMQSLPGQRLNGYFSGDEALVITHMHPQHPRLEAMLPRLRARCWIRRAGDDALEALPTVADTLWLFPNDQMGLLLYRATASLADPDGDDVTHLLLGWEDGAAEPLPEARYRDCFATELGWSPAVAAPIAAADSDAGAADFAASPSAPEAANAGREPPAQEPAAADPELDALLQQIAAETDRIEQQTAALLASRGLTLADVMPNAEAGQGDDLPLETLLAKIEQETERIEAETRELMARSGLSEKDLTPSPAEADVPLAELLAQIEQQTRKLRQQRQRLELDPAQAEQTPDFSALASLLETLDALGDASTTDNGASATAAPDRNQGEASEVSEGSGASATPAPQSRANEPETPLRWTRERVADACRARQSLAGEDLSGLDLSGLRLAGADLSEVILVGANLERADLSEVNLSGAMASDVQLRQASLVRARLDDADCGQADFSGADLREASLRRLRAGGANLTAVRAQRCDAAQASFAGALLKDVQFTDAQLAAASLCGTSGSGADFSGADCTRAEFYGARLEGACFARAMLVQSRAGSDTVFDGGCFTDAQLTGANWMRASLRGARFERVIADDGDFSRVTAAGSCWAGCQARRLRLDKADLRDADLRNANFLYGSLRLSRLDGAVLTHANLFGVDFDGVCLQPAQLEGACTGSSVNAIRWI